MAVGDSPLAPSELYASSRRKKRGIPALVWILLIAAAAAGGAYVGMNVLQKPINFGTLGGQTTLSENELDAVIATYVWEDEVYEVTAREAMAHESSLDGMRNADGAYVMPSAESVLSAVRTAVLMRDVASRGITVSDEELAAYVSENFDTDDIASLAVAYGMDEETARARLQESAAMAKLRTEVVTAQSAEPARPSAPEDGSESAESADYASYILQLAGDEWDGKKNAWKSDDGPYATALKEYDISNESATYGAALTAYDVAYQYYSASIAAANTQWTDYVNEQLSKANLALGSIVS